MRDPRGYLEVQASATGPPLRVGGCLAWVVAGVLVGLVAAVLLVARWLP